MRLFRRGPAIIALAALALILSGCGSGEPAPGGSPEPSSPAAQPGTSGFEVVTIEESVPEEWVREPGPRPEVSQDLVARMGSLGMDLWQFQRAQQPGTNVWVSPVSGYQALSLLTPGVAAEANEELLSAMGLDTGDIEGNTEELADWITASRRSDYQMALYNAAFVARDYGGFAPGYLQAIEPIRNELGGFDALNPQGTADQINARVAEHTRGLIKEILGPSDIPPDLVFILLNTTYFKGAWVQPFPPDFTGQSNFTLLDGTVVPIEAMSQMMPLAVAEADGYTAAVLPYEGGAKAVIVLPDRGRFDEVAGGLTAAALSDLAGAEVAAANYWVTLPKFTSDSGIQELTPALQSLGVSRMFVGTPNWPMFDNGDLHSIFFVKQRVVVAVNELGTEAAAATAIGGIGGAEPQYAFVVDRPFLMAILDADNSVLFVGQVTDPR